MRRWSTAALRVAAIAIAATVLGGCQSADIPKHLKPVPPALLAEMGRLDMKETSQIFIRIFKEESALEVWKERRDGTFALLKTFEICSWSGELGPKRVEGDRQAPEGFYTVTPAQMNPNSNYYLSFNIGYPNTYDRSLGRTGSNLMVHGACSSAGCYSMTDESAGELFALARDSFRGGQRSFQIQAFPFRLTPENLAKHRTNPNMDFWRMLKVGYDSFELARVPPRVDVCDRRYVFNAEGSVVFDATAACPAYSVPQPLALALAAKEAADDQRFSAVVAALDQQAGGNQVAAAKPISTPVANASKPSLLTRFLDVFGHENPAPAPVGSVSPAGLASPATAALPLPIERPRLAPMAASASPATVAAPAMASAASANPVRETPPVAVTAGGEPPQSLVGAAPIITPDLAYPNPTVGTFVQRQFWWYDETPPAATTAN